MGGETLVEDDLSVGMERQETVVLALFDLQQLHLMCWGKPLFMGVDVGVQLDMGGCVRLRGGMRVHVSASPP